MLSYCLYLSQSQYLQFYLSGPDATIGFHTITPSELWKKRLQGFDSYATDIELQANAAGVPITATLIPNRAQASMISLGVWPATLDPYRLDDELRS